MISQRLAQIDVVVSNKTGKVIDGNVNGIKFTGSVAIVEIAAVERLTCTSTHPFIVLIAKPIEEPPSRNYSDDNEADHLKWFRSSIHRLSLFSNQHPTINLPLLTIFKREGRRILMAGEATLAVDYGTHKN